MLFQRCKGVVYFIMSTPFLTPITIFASSCSNFLTKVVSIILFWFLLCNDKITWRKGNFFSSKVNQLRFWNVKISNVVSSSIGFRFETFYHICIFSYVNFHQLCVWCDLCDIIYLLISSLQLIPDNKRNILKNISNPKNILDSMFW